MVLPIPFKPKPDTLYYLVWPGGTKQKVNALLLMKANDAVKSDFITFFFFEDRAATFAIHRIETDESGWCETCGEPIGDKRLELDPTLTRWVGSAR